MAGMLSGQARDKCHPPLGAVWVGLTGGGGILGVCIKKGGDEPGGVANFQNLSTTCFYWVKYSRLPFPSGHATVLPPRLLACTDAAEDPTGHFMGGVCGRILLSLAVF